ncbi:MAG: xanthine dehydrogenase family protein molybdopterin-binding subunit [Burkholderiaceae bacterium]
MSWALVQVDLHGTTDIEPVKASVGSDSIREFALPLAQACATLRDALAAGRTHGTIAAQDRPVHTLRTFAGTASRTVRSAPLEHGEAIVRGQALYAADVRRPGQRFGRVLRAPASPELASRLVALDEAAARAVPGFVALVRDPLLAQGRAEGIGIVATTPGALDRVAAALAPRWAVDGGFEAADIERAIDVDRRLDAGALAHRLRRDAVDPQAVWDLDLRLDVPPAAHAPIEPRAAVAEWTDTGELHAWVGNQDVFYIRDVIASRLGLPTARVVVQGMRVGGAFGGKTIATVELEAAVLAKAVGGAVKVRWTRAQEFALGFHRPASSHRIRARLRDGRIIAWWHAFASGHVLFTNAVLPAWIQRLTDVIGDDGVARGAVPPYRIDAARVEFDLVRLPILGGPWRGLGAGPNAMAIETAMDELARRARIDPVAFRLAHIDDPRLARVLRRAVEVAPPPRVPVGVGTRSGRGVACGIYKQASYVAVVADVEVDASDGTVRVVAMTCAHDCGRVIDEDQVRAQCEGNLVWGLGMVLVEALPIGSGTVSAATFADSPIPRFSSMPAMRVALVDEGDAPSGAGETAIVAAAGSIGNAVADATGYRPVRLPIRATDVHAHLRRAAG